MPNHPVFADACYWIALLIRQDALHHTAMRLERELRNRRVVTSEMVLAETLNAVSRYGPERRRAAVTMVRRIAASGEAHIIAQRTEQFWDAVAYYYARPDQQWGLVDCASFQIMEEWGIREALTNDRHFAQAGFNILM